MIDRFMEMIANSHGKTKVKSCFYGNLEAESLR
jgi:hypothetical protein